PAPIARDGAATGSSGGVAHAVDAIRVIVGHVEAAVPAEHEVHRPADHAVALPPAARELADAHGVSVEAHPDDRVARGRQPRPRAMERDEEIIDVLRRELAAGIEDE